MQKRLSQLLEAFQHLKFEQCLRMSDQILKKLQKTDSKKKANNITDNDLQSLYLTRIGSLAALGQLHQANQLINQKFPQPIISEQSSFLFLQICSMAIDRRIPTFTATISQSKNAKSIDINRYILLSHKFSQLSRIFLARYAGSKDKEKSRADSFAQIYLEYLQQLENFGMVGGFKRDRVVRENRAIGFKIVWMFLEKFIQLFNGYTANLGNISTEQSNKYLKTRKSICDTKLKLLLHQGKSQQIRSYLIQNQKFTKDNIFIYLRSLKLLTDQPSQNSTFWLQQHLKIFRSNLNLDNYQPIYDYSIEFINQLIRETGLKFEVMGELKRITQDELYGYRQDYKEQMGNFVDSLYSQYWGLKEREADLGSKDFYKIAMKNCLLLLIYVLAKGGNWGYVREFLLRYKEDYGKKLTFPDQIRDYFSNPLIFTAEFTQKFKQTPNTKQNSEDALIWLINYERLFAKNPTQQSLQQNYLEWQRLYNLYQANLIQVQKQKKLQKGQRYLSDQLLTILADSIRKYTEEATEKELSDTQREEVYFYILAKLEQAIVKSYSNHDIKLRAVYFNNKLNYHQQSIKLLQSLDIKAVQYQTLGYLYLHQILTFCSWDQNEQILTKMIKSYQQVFKQSLQYSYKALSNESFNQCEENLSYYHHIERSYNFVVLLYVMYMKNRGKDNCQFYLREILDRVGMYGDGKGGNKGGFTFNADFRVFKNVIEFGNENCYADFYGIYNNSSLLQTQTKTKLLLTLLSTTPQSPQIPQLTTSLSLSLSLPPQKSPSHIYNFSNYQLYQHEINYKYSDQKFHHERTNSIWLGLNWRVGHIVLAVVEFLGEVRRDGVFGEVGEKVRGLVKELGGVLGGLTWRQQVMFLPSIRYQISQIIPALATQIDSLSTKSKKKSQNQALKKQACQQLVTFLIESITDGIKLQERPKIDKKFVKEVYIHRDQLLERVSKMTANQYRKFYRIKG